MSLRFAKENKGELQKATKSTVTKSTLTGGTSIAFINPLERSFTGKNIWQGTLAWIRYPAIAFEIFTKWLHRSVDASALGVFRICYGIIMMIDLAEERGGGQLDVRFGEPLKCHFPLFGILSALSFPIMACIYLIMWLGLVGIILGYCFHTSCLMYILPYWYIFLLDKATWNNHSYLFGLVGTLIYFTQANHYCSLDRYLKRYNANTSTNIPYWNYFVIKFQFFILYMYAGLKKLTPEWLAGYAMSSLGHHWVLIPFRWFLTSEQVDLLIIHWLTAIFDFFIAFLMTWQLTRVWATPFMILFHLMNSRLFTIGMFPWVCLAQVPMFFGCNWPRRINSKLKYYINSYRKSWNHYHIEDIAIGSKDGGRQTKSKQTADQTKLNDAKSRTCFILLYCCLQMFLPYSHFITKGYNNWTQGLYGYSWDMMVHSYNTIDVQIKIVDNSNRLEHYLYPYAFTEYERWTKYADMAKQYAQCIYGNLHRLYKEQPELLPIQSLNVSIYFDVWCSMNGRLMQRVFDPRVDLLTADWSPFRTTSWSLPLLDQFKYMRPKLLAISHEVYKWNNASDLLFVADYPELTLTNIPPADIINTTLSIFEGIVRFTTSTSNQSYVLRKDERIIIPNNATYHIKTIGPKPSIYMITFTNQTMLKYNLHIPDYIEKSREMEWLPLRQEFQNRITNYIEFLKHIGNGLLYLIYGVPIPLRVRESQQNFS